MTMKLEKNQAQKNKSCIMQSRSEDKQKFTRIKKIVDNND